MNVPSIRCCFHVVFRITLKIILHNILRGWGWLPPPGYLGYIGLSGNATTGHAISMHFGSKCAEMNCLQLHRSDSTKPAGKKFPDKKSRGWQPPPLRSARVNTSIVQL